MHKFRSLPTLVLAGLFVFLVLGTAVAQPPQPTMPANPVSFPFDPKTAAIDAVSDAIAEGSILDIAVNPDFDEAEPAVALCAGDQYLAVFEYGSEIYAQYLDNQGTRLGIPFVVSSDIYMESHPDVACDWSRNVFIVVWQHDYNNSGDMDIQAQGILGTRPADAVQSVSAALNVANTTLNETNPVVECNSNASSCLVVYEREDNSGDIYGQRLAISSSLTLQGGAFVIGSFGVAEGNPAIAWGGPDSDYLVAWEYKSTNYRIVVAYVWDTLMGGSQIQASGTFLTGSDLANHQINPAAAYNGRTQRYLVVFQHDFYNDGSDYDIWGLRLVPGGGSQGALFLIAGYGQPEIQPAIAYGSGPYYLPGGYGADQFLVTYVREDATQRIVLGQAIYGSVQPSQQKEGSPVLLYSTGSGINFGLANPAVIGSINNGRYLAVWESMIGGFTGDDYNVRGQLVAPYGVFLPAIIK